MFLMSIAPIKFPESFGKPGFLIKGQLSKVKLFPNCWKLFVPVMVSSPQLSNVSCLQSLQLLIQSWSMELHSLHNFTSTASVFTK